MALLIRDAEVEGRRCDVVLRDGRVAEVVPAGSRAAETLDVLLHADGGALLPGFSDDHLHMYALASARRSVLAGHTRADLTAALRTAAPDSTGWIRAVGSGDAALDAAALDQIRPDVPTRVQHRSGAMWVLNSAAVAALARLGPLDHPGVERGPDGQPTGRVHRADDWLRDRVPPVGLPDLTALGRELAGYGVTAVTDATPDLEPVAAAGLTVVPQRLTLLGVPVGTPPPPGAALGPSKIVLADPDLPTPDELAARIQAAHEAGRPVAVHAVTREALVVLLVALDAAGRVPGDRVEHAALVPAELVPELAGLTVVTQPGFLTDRGDDYRRRVPAADHADLYRCRSLLDAGVAVVLSSDAPYGPVDPWAVLRAATTRTTPDGAPLGPQEALTPREALDCLIASAAGAVPRVRVGEPADLVLLHPPLAEALRTPDAAHVRATWIAGALVHGSPVR